MSAILQCHQPQHPPDPLLTGHAAWLSRLAQR